VWLPVHIFASRATSYRTSAAGETDSPTDRVSLLGTTGGSVCFVDRGREGTRGTCVATGP
jgi:hypothetical protein